MVNMFVAIALKFFFLMTPFFALSMFLAMTPQLTEEQRDRLANRVIFAAWIITMLLFLCGQVIFRVFGVSVDAFRIGAGALLFLSAVSLMNPKVKADAYSDSVDIAVVPMALPVIIGPATCGNLLVMGAEQGSWKLRVLAMLAMTGSLYVLWVILRMAAWMERHLGQKGLSILMRLTGLILSALSAQMIMTGVTAFLRGA